MIAVIDERTGDVFYCTIAAEARMVERMLDLVGADHQTIEYHKGA